MHRGATLLMTMLLGLALANAQSRLNRETSPMKPGQAGENVFIGLISDASCGARHKMRDKSAEECTRTCQRSGQPYVLVAGEKMFRLNGNPNEIGLLAGQKAKITGRLQGDAIEVASILPAQ